MYFENQMYGCDLLRSSPIEQIRKANTPFSRKREIPANRIYNARHDLCKNRHDTKCCSTCKQIQVTKVDKIQNVLLC